MSDQSLSSHTSPRFAKIALIAAAAIAVLAIGFTIWNQTPAGEMTRSTKQASPQPDVESMISGLEAKLKDKPNDANGWRMLGWAFFESGKYAEAATAYARATQLEPNKPEYWSSLGEARVLAGPGNVTRDAKAAFERAFSLDAKDPRARYFLAVEKDMSGNHKGAIDDWLALLADTPAGAPWEADVRKLISEVGAKEKIDVASRLANIRNSSPPPATSIATSAIPGPSAAEMRSASQLPKGQQDAMVQSMVEGLAKKLAANPLNESGWIMLMRSRIQLGETVKAKIAYQTSKTAFANNLSAIKRLELAASELGIEE